jgi:hypothetical protein
LQFADIRVNHCKLDYILQNYYFFSKKKSSKSFPIIKINEIKSAASEASKLRVVRFQKLFKTSTHCENGSEINTLILC